MRTVIHRNHTFEYQGDAYQCTRQGPYGSGDSVWEVYRVRDGRTINDGIFYELSEIRAWVDSARVNGWPLIQENA